MSFLPIDSLNSQALHPLHFGHDFCRCYPSVNRGKMPYHGSHELTRLIAKSETEQLPGDHPSLVPPAVNR